jgi:hypothetical protein
MTSGAMETNVRAFETHEPNYADRPARLFFIFEAHSPQEIAGACGGGNRALPVGGQDSEL